MNKMRTHTCGELSKAQLTERVRLAGWVDTIRDHGGVIFIDLRDRYGITQVIFDPNDSRDAWDVAQTARGEFVIQAEGVVEARPADMANPRLATGEIEVRCDQIRILNKSRTTPFPLDDKDADKVSEDLRLQYRYLDLRRSRMQRNLRVRHQMSQSVRSYLDEAGFTDVETPILTKSTPEGARDYLVPSRVVPGSFYALPQAPQQYKQLLMMAGVDRYFQIARCFRDEDLRADRQPEFTQIDIEMSFITPDDIYALIDGLIAHVMTAVGKGPVQTPIPRLTYHEAMNRYGSDKPDIRFGMELVDLSSVFTETGFKVFRQVLDQGGVVKAVNAKGLGGVPIRVMDEWTELARQWGLGGLAYIRAQEDGEWKSPILKFFSDEEKAQLKTLLAIEPGDLVFFAADQADTANTALGHLRLVAGEKAGVIDDSVYAFTWVTDFPLFEQTAEGRLTPVHHPFTSMHPDDVELLTSAPERIRAQAYDIVLNGVELGGGSIRIHDPELQAEIFSVLQMPQAEVEDRFGHLIQALSYGAPPHGGIALGFDRFVMMVTGEDSIRDVIAFPKTQKAMDLMMNAPATVDAKQLRDVHIKLDILEE